MALPAQSEATAAWRAVEMELRNRLGDLGYEIWFQSVQPQSWDGELLLLRTPEATQTWIAERFGAVLQHSAEQALGAQSRIAFTTGVRQAATPSGSAALEVSAMSGFNPRYSFEQFIIGEGNRLAHAAALAVAELPGQAYNPLFIYAPPGLGKTHLLHAIGNYVLAFGGGCTVRYTTAEAFTNHFLAALGSRSLEPFKRAYRDADVLLIDDVQFLASKARTEEEFFHTFNALYETGRQLVLTCDRLPRALVSIEQRLRERFEAGLVADISVPDHATRVAILRKRAALDHVALSDSAVLDVIADRVTDNIRALEGAFIRVVAYHSLTQRPIDVGLTTEVLDALYPTPGSRTPSIQDIQSTVAAHFDLSVTQLNSASRAVRVSWPRQLAIHLARDLTSASLPAIGRAFGGRNHTTVIHACKRVSERLKQDPQAVEELDRLTRLLSSGHADRDC